MTVPYELYVKTDEGQYRLVGSGEAPSLPEAARVLLERVPDIEPLDALAMGCAYHDRDTRPLRATRQANSTRRNGLVWSGM